MFKKVKEFILKFKDLSSLTIATIGTNGIGGIFWLYFASILGTEQYGEVSYLISIAILASTISLLGMTNTAIVYGSKGEKIQSTTYITVIISSITASAIVFFLIIKNLELGIYIIGFVGFTLITSNLLGQKFYSKYSKVIISQKLLLVIFAIFFYEILGQNGIILGIGISFLPFFMIIFKSFKEQKIKFSIFKNKFKFISNSYLLDLAGAFNGSLDKIIMAPILGFTILGNYQLGLQFISLMIILPGIFYTYTLPQDSRGESTKAIKKIMILISIIITVLSIILSPFLVPIFFPDFIEAVEVIQIMSLSVISSTVISAYVSKFLGQTNSKPVILGSATYLGVQIPLLIILGISFGVNGTALSVVIASITHALFLIIYDKKISKMHI